MRKTALLWLFLAALCGGILFQTASRVNDGLSRLSAINASVKKEDESLRVLQAEWSYLNQPERLEKLSKKYLGLEPLKGKQFGKVSELEERPEELLAAEQAVIPVPEPAPKKIVVEKPPVVVLKPVETASPVLTPPVVKQKPQPKSAWREPPRTAQPRSRVPAHEGRDFSDVMKSLGVQ